MLALQHRFIRLAGAKNSELSNRQNMKRKQKQQAIIAKRVKQKRNLRENISKAPKAALTDK
jgi:hypothetical protein